VHDLDLARHQVVVRHGKGGKQRIVPITDTVDDDQIRAAMTAAVAG